MAKKLILISFLFVLFILISSLLLAIGAAYIREKQEFGTLPDQGGRIVATDAGEMFVLERGPVNGIPVVLTHGTAAWSGLWLPTMEHLAENGYRAIAFDMPPFGYSRHADDGDYSRQRQAERFLALLGSFKTRPIVVAHSFSAGMVAEAAMMDQGSFSALVFVDAAIGLNSHLEPKTVPMVLKPRFVRRAEAAATVSNPLLTGPFLRSFIHIKTAATQPVIEVLRQPMTRKGYTHAAADWLPHLFQSPVGALSTRPENWKTLSLPVEFIWGDKDTITPLSQAEELSALTPRSSLTVLQGVGHIPQVESPDLLQKNLVTVLNRLLFHSLRGSLQ